MGRVRTAIIGTGFIGPVHAEALRRISHLTNLKAIAGINDTEADEAAARLNIPSSTGDYKTLLKREDIDAVHICTPNYLHYPMVKEALEAGKHVLCEKPLALTSAEAEELANLATEKKLTTAVNYNLRYYPMVQEMKKNTEDGTTGDIFAVQGSYMQDWLLHETDYSWRLESGLSGKTRAVADIGTHWMDMAQYITGQKITAVCAQFSRMYEHRKKDIKGQDLTFNKAGNKDTSSYTSYKVDTEDYAAILVQFEKGTTGSLTVSQVSAGYKNKLEYIQSGKKASLTWNSEQPNQIMIGHRDRANEILVKDPSLLHGRAASMSTFPGGHQEGYGETLKHLFRDFYNKILNNETQTDCPSFREGAYEMHLCEAILKSAETGRWVKVIS